MEPQHNNLSNHAHHHQQQLEQHHSYLPTIQDNFNQICAPRSDQELGGQIVNQTLGDNFIQTPRAFYASECNGPEQRFYCSSRVQATRSTLTSDSTFPGLMHGSDQQHQAVYWLNSTQEPHQAYRAPPPPPLIANYAAEHPAADIEASFGLSGLEPTLETAQQCAEPPPVPASCYAGELRSAGGGAQTNQSYAANGQRALTNRHEGQPATGGHEVGVAAPGEPERPAVGPAVGEQNLDEGCAPERVIQRSKANKKERRRTQSINQAFSDLRRHIPDVPSDTKLSKINRIVRHILESGASYHV